jgi:hypothetical protein
MIDRTILTMSSKQSTINQVNIPDSITGGVG